MENKEQIKAPDALYKLQVENKKLKKMVNKKVVNWMSKLLFDLIIVMFLITVFIPFNVLTPIMYFTMFCLTTGSAIVDYFITTNERTKKI